MSQTKISALVPPVLSDGSSFSLNGSFQTLLPHPRNDVACMFAVSSDPSSGKQCLFEIQRGERTHGPCSAFIDETVKSDASLTVFSLFDPLFLVLKWGLKFCEVSGKTYFQRNSLVDFMKSNLSGSGIPPAAFNDLDRLMRSSLMHSRLLTVCSQHQDLFDDILYTLDRSKIIAEIKRKVDHVVTTVAPQGASGPPALDMPEFAFATSVSVSGDSAQSVRPDLLALRRAALQYYEPMLTSDIVETLRTDLGLVVHQPAVMYTAPPPSRFRRDDIFNSDKKDEPVEKAKKVETKAERDARLHGTVQKNNILGFFQKKA